MLRWQVAEKRSSTIRQAHGPEQRRRAALPSQRLASPPVGGSLVVVSAVTGEDFWRLCGAVMPFLVVETLVLLVLILVPEISLVVPRYFGY